MIQLDRVFFSRNYAINGKLEKAFIGIQVAFLNRSSPNRDLFPFAECSALLLRSLRSASFDRAAGCSWIVHRRCVLPAHTRNLSAAPRRSVAKGDRGTVIYPDRPGSSTSALADLVLPSSEPDSTRDITIRATLVLVLFG